MPLRYIKTSRKSTVAVWHTTEDVDDLLHEIILTESVQATLGKCKPHRRREIIGTRYLLNQILAEQVTIIKDHNGRPVIKEYPLLNLSLSHSGDYSAIMLSHEQSIGIDIQVHRENIRTIAPKFLYQDEIVASDIGELHYYWGVKESVFKAWSKGGVDFKSMINVQPMKVKKTGMTTSVVFDNSMVRQNYAAQGIKIDNLYLVSVMIER